MNLVGTTLFFWSNLSRRNKK